MAKTMQRKLLEHLANVIEIDYVDLLQYFKEYHSATQTEDYLDTVRETLVTLIYKNNYVQLKETIPIIEIGKIRNHNNVDVVLTLDRAIELWGDKLKGKITNEGRHYLADIIRNEKQDDINSTLKRNSNIQVGTAIAVGIFTVFNVIIAGFTLYQNSTKQKTQETSAQELKDSLTQIKNKLQTGRDEYLLFQKEVKDSLKSISERTR